MPFAALSEASKSALLTSSDKGSDIVTLPPFLVNPLIKSPPKSTALDPTAVAPPNIPPPALDSKIFCNRWSDATSALSVGITAPPKAPPAAPAASLRIIPPTTPPGTTIVGNTSPTVWNPLVMPI